MIPLVLAALIVAVLWSAEPAQRAVPGQAGPAQRDATGRAPNSAASASAWWQRLRPAGPASALDLAGMIERLSILLVSGASPRRAWQLTAEVESSEPLAQLARAVGEGADPRRASPGSLAASAHVQALGMALEVGERSGAPMADLLRSLASAQRDLHDAALARRSAFAGPRSTARILLALPLAGIGLGLLLGANPLRILLQTTTGLLLLIIGLLLTLAGWTWMRRLLNSAEGTHHHRVDPSVLLELIAGALSAGLPLGRAAGIVAASADERTAQDPAIISLSRFAASLSGGIPSALAARHLDPTLRVLGQSALLSESAGADLARVLRSAAADARRGRARDAEAAAARLAVRLVLPTGIALLPAFVLLGIIPTVASMLGGSFSSLSPG